VGLAGFDNGHEVAPLASSPNVAVLIQSIQQIIILISIDLSD
jgi:hypothetical protein